MNRICPECQTGKHQNCNGEADIDVNGNFLSCQCEDPSHNKLVWHNLNGSDILIGEEIETIWIAEYSDEWLERFRKTKEELPSASFMQVDQTGKIARTVFYPRLVDIKTNHI